MNELVKNNYLGLFCDFWEILFDKLDFWDFPMLFEFIPIDNPKNPSNKKSKKNLLVKIVIHYLRRTAHYVRIFVHDFKHSKITCKDLHGPFFNLSIDRNPQKPQTGLFFQSLQSRALNILVHQKLKNLYSWYTITNKTINSINKINAMRLFSGIDC